MRRRRPPGGARLPAIDQLRRYFETIVPGATLLDAWLAIRRVGGHPARRLRRGGVYTPFMLFEPGCVIDLGVAQGGDAAGVERRLGELLATGLPPCRWEAGGTLKEIKDWNETIYLPQAGFGEVSIAPGEGAASLGAAA